MPGRPARREEEADAAAAPPPLVAPGLGLGLGLAALAGCSTIAGAGEDVGAAGRAVSTGAETAGRAL